LALVESLGLQLFQFKFVDATLRFMASEKSPQIIEALSFPERPSILVHFDTIFTNSTISFSDFCDVQGGVFLQNALNFSTLFVAPRSKFGRQFLCPRLRRSQ